MRKSSVASAFGVGVALLLLYAPLLAAAPTTARTQTLTLYTSVCALIGCVAVLAYYERRDPPPAVFVGLGALFGALSSLMIVNWASGSDAVTLRTRVLIIAAFYASGSWILTASLRRLVPEPRRLAAFTALLFAVVTVFGPHLVASTPLERQNLADLAIMPVVLYWTVGTSLVTLPLLALTTLPGDWFERWWNAAAAKFLEPSSRAFAIGLVAVTIVLAVVFSWYCFGARPITSDEIAQLWQARILLTGRFALPADPNPEFFAVDNIIDHPQWMSQFPIGGPLFDILGVAVGLTWLTNPIFTGLTALNVYRFVQRAYDEAQARVAAVVFVASPMVLVMGASHMNHMPTAWLATLALAALPLWLRATNPRDVLRPALVIGVSIGVIATIRPLDAALVAVIIGGVMLAVAARERQRLNSLWPAAAAGAVPVALLLWSNWKMTGAPLRFGYTVLWGPNHSLGLHADPTGIMHTPWRALLLSLRYLSELNGFVTTWPVPVFLIIALGLVVAANVRRWDALLLTCFGLQVFAYAFYWHDGQFAGPRFLFTALPALLIVVARAPFMLAEGNLGPWRRAALLLVPASIFTSWVRPMGPFGVQGMATEYRAARTSLKRGAPPDSLMGRLPKALVFVQEHANSRLVRRLWALGVSRPDAGRWMRDADACSLFMAVRLEEARGVADSAGRKERIERGIVRFNSPGGRAASDSTFRSDLTTAIGTCSLEVAHDKRIATYMSYGPFLLRNQLDALGRISGQVVYVMDLSDRNETLRARFGDRAWYRWEIPAGTKDSLPVLVPYDSASKPGGTR